MVSLLFAFVSLSASLLDGDDLLSVRQGGSVCSAGKSKVFIDILMTDASIVIIIYTFERVPSTRA